MNSSFILFGDHFEINEIAEKVTVSRIIDGDTIVVNSKQGKEIVRLLLVDTPEIVHPDIPEQPYARQAGNFVKSTINNKTQIWLERGNPKLDYYGRTLGYIWYEEANEKLVNLNIELVFKGLGRLSIYDDNNVKYLSKYKKAMKIAKRKRLNIWSANEYVTDAGFNSSIFE